MLLPLMQSSTFKAARCLWDLHVVGERCHWNHTWINWATGIKKNLCTTSTYVIQIVFRRLLLNAMWAVVKTYHCNDLHIRTYILELITRSLRAKLEFKGTGLFAMLSRTFRFSRPVKCPGPGQRKEILSVRRSQVREYHLKISFRMFDTFWYIYVYIYIL